MKHFPPKYQEKSFNCPSCGILSQQTWSRLVRVYYDEFNASSQKSSLHYDVPISVCKCKHCSDFSIWKSNLMIYPTSGSVEVPNSDMPDDVLEDYNEAKEIVNLSPRGATALLRLGLQKLCIHLGEKGENINKDIKSLVAKGLPETIQQALDSVRVVGNNAVHPGQLDLKDDVETAYKLFGFLNIICEVLITQPNRIKEFYEMKLPQGTRDAIEKRDGKV